MTKFSSSDGKSEVGEEASAIFNAVEDATYEVLRGMQQRGDEQQPHHLYVVLTAAAAAIQIAAKIMSSPNDKTAEEFAAWVEEPVDRTAILAAALLVSRCMLPGKQGVNFEFNPPNIKAAMDAVKKVTGNDGAAVLNQQMVVSAQKHAAPVHFFDNSRDQFGDLYPTVH